MISAQTKSYDNSVTLLRAIDQYIHIYEYLSEATRININILLNDSLVDLVLLPESECHKVVCTKKGKRTYRGEN